MKKGEELAVLKKVDMLIELASKAALYEKLRRMNPQEFTELYRKNISTGVAFDELLDKWPE